MSLIIFNREIRSDRTTKERKRSSSVAGQEEEMHFIERRGSKGSTTTTTTTELLHEQEKERVQFVDKVVLMSLSSCLAVSYSLILKCMRRREVLVVHLSRPFSLFLLSDAIHTQQFNRQEIENRKERKSETREEKEPRNGRGIRIRETDGEKERQEKSRQ